MSGQMPPTAPRAMREQRSSHIIDSQPRPQQTTYTHQRTQNYTSGQGTVTPWAIPHHGLGVPHQRSSYRNYAFGPTDNGRGGVAAPMASGDSHTVPPGFDRVHHDRASRNPGHSISWTSEEEELRSRFTSMRKKARHLGLQKSPYLPRDVAEYTGIVVDMKVKESAHLSDRLQQDLQLTEERENAKAALEQRARLAAHPMIMEDARLFNQLLDAPSPQGPVQPLFLGKQGVAQDGLSAVLATEHSAFNRPLPGKCVPQDNNWPNQSYFKTRTGSQYLPPSSPKTWNG